MDNNETLSGLMVQMATITEKITKAIETGEGMNIPDDQKENFKKLIDEKGVKAKIDEMRSNLENLFKQKS